MLHRVDCESHVPVFLQIVEHLRSAIAAGVYRSGEALPSLRVLAGDFRVNPNTVQRAYDEMARQGLVESQRGVGIFVARRATHSALSRAERAAVAAFARAATQAAHAGLKRQRIRELFDSALEQVVRTSESKI
jgi:GntR family transcriptional regulator